MTTVIPFLPSNIVTPSISVTLDGVDHDVRITWNVSSQRFFINVYRKSDGAWIITTALVSSPPARGVQSAVYDPFLNSVDVTFEDPSLWPLPVSGPITKPGTIIEYTLEGFQPPTYNGKFRCLHRDPLVFTFPMPTNPGPIVILGRVSRLLSMIDTVFQISTMVYRNGAFEITP
jgi:hypothetical protein